MPAQPLWSPTWKLDHVGVRAPSRVAAQPHLPWCALYKLRADGGSFASQHFLAWSARAGLLFLHQPGKWTDFADTVFLFVLTASRGIVRLSLETQYLGTLLK